jgi:hypothetical protein
VVLHAEAQTFPDDDPEEGAMAKQRKRLVSVPLDQLTNDEIDKLANQCEASEPLHAAELRRFRDNPVRMRMRAARRALRAATGREPTVNQVLAELWRRGDPGVNRVKRRSETEG